MDPNTQVPITNPQAVNQTPEPQSVTPAETQIQPAVQVKPQQEQKGSKKILKLLLIILILIILGIGGFFAYSYFNAPKTYNAGVYNYPTSVPTTPTPTDVLNPNDTSNSSIDSNNKTVDTNLNSLDSDLNNVNDSLNDKQTNLN